MTEETVDWMENYRQERQNRDGNCGRVLQDWYEEDAR
jgi:hypothetical protein